MEKMFHTKNKNKSIGSKLENGAVAANINLNNGVNNGTTSKSSQILDDKFLKDKTDQLSSVVVVFEIGTDNDERDARMNNDDDFREITVRNVDKQDNSNIDTNTSTTAVIVSEGVIEEYQQDMGNIKNSNTDDLQDKKQAQSLTDLCIENLESQNEGEENDSETTMTKERLKISDRKTESENKKNTLEKATAEEFQEIVENVSEVDIGIRITTPVTDSSLEDEEVKTIMESCDELEQPIIQRVRNLRRIRKPRKYEEIKTGRKRSRSFDNGSLQCPKNFDFTKYGISIGSGLPHDLLPGIEDYLCNVLANESLSEYAEEQRQYFLERLDIIKLPPSIPPRPQSLGVRLYPVHSSPTSSNRDSLPSLEQDDFAAYQRELSRALVVDGDSSPNVTEVKVYDDIDITDGSIVEAKTSKPEEDSMYEIPQIQRTLSDSGYEKALELSHMSKSTSSEEQLSGQSGTTMPPPLPPRGERTGSDAASRSSIGSILEDRLSDSPLYRSKLNRESSVPARLEKSCDSRSERSSDDLLDVEYDGASCESLDEIGTLARNQNPDLRVKLPRPVKRKHIAHHRKLGKSLSSLWEITQPFGMLEDVVMSGELHYRSKLTWTRKIVALINGRLVCYKVDKTDSRPAFVILLTGYVATAHKRDGRRSFEIHLDHENFEPYIFLVDFKEWAEIWCEHINAAAKGQRAPGPVIHLARSSMIADQDGTYHLANYNLQQSNSNASLASSEGFEVEPGTVKVKKRDQSGTKTAKMGSFAFKATQFFENLGKRSSTKRTSSTGSDRTPSVERIRHLSGSQTSLTETSEKLSPLTSDSQIEESPLESQLETKKHIKHQGYLDIYSSFNKRKWGKRWCLVHENNFECYHTQTSEVCELEFLLRNCILRRAIEETKSELGLMLMESNKERITIEPINWTELGSWLRILMQETSTSVTPKGLEGYMDDSHPYHEAVEITRVTDSSQKETMPAVKSKVSAVHGGYDKRDSGICSSGSTDDRFNSLERRRKSPTVHPCFTDSSLPRVSVSETGAIYTQVKKHTDPSSNSSRVAGRKSNSNQSEGSKHTSKPDHIHICDSDTVKAVRKSDGNGEKSVFDFDIDSFNEPSFKRESSLVDEIMSELKIQQSLNVTYDANDNLTSNVNNSFAANQKQCEFISSENELSPIKSVDNTMTGSDSDFLCSSFVEITENNTKVEVENNPNSHEPVSTDHVIESRVSSNDIKDPFRVRRHPSNVSTYGIRDSGETLAELRTRLVQLKKDRISIRDRKQVISSETDKEFLEAEYERLNRECKKVTDEISTIEESTVAESHIGSGKTDIKPASDEFRNGETKIEGLHPDLYEQEGDKYVKDEKESNCFVLSEETNTDGTSNEATESSKDCKEELNFENLERDKVKIANDDSMLDSKVIDGSKNPEAIAVLERDNPGLCISTSPLSTTDIDSLCNSESNNVCDTDNVPTECIAVQNTHVESQELDYLHVKEQITESDETDNISADYVIDLLSKDFENKMFLKENQS